MMKVFLSFLVLYFIALPSYCQPVPPSPEKFLGYRLGSKYTPHHKIAAYFEAVATALPGRVKIEKYGETYEGRPLMVVFVSSPQNIGRLEEIRLNNLRLARQSNDGVAPGENTPAIVWLSYNVHGNEPSSSEAAMKTFHALVDPSDSRTAAWLQNTVVVIDPCINPDGRDRYANWQNSVASLVPDADPQAREHREPWPGGRTNHYYFDLNRDWAWQTQAESRQRLAIYNRWLPQVHVDFHEQGFNQPYYFAPAAEPYHEVITPWQREFQSIIGKNNARYFDAKGWLYFTKERFDLFYPSYGDTYPTYNGSIGMTFEQGGGPRGGKAVVTEDGDTLTLADRLEHHYTTGLSTIEMTSKHASRLISEFRKFFNDGTQNGAGEHKAFLVKGGAKSSANMATLLSYLRNNHIAFGWAQSRTGLKGFSYLSGREENLSVNDSDLVIPVQQARAALVRVLFEPRSRLTDSATYDITAWSLPYAMGLDAYALKEKPAFSPGEKTGALVNAGLTSENAFAYIVPWNGTGSAQLLAQLLKAGVRVRYAEQPFVLEGRTFDRGSLILKKPAAATESKSLYQRMVEALLASPGFSGRIVPVGSGMVEKGVDFGSSGVRPVKAPRVALLAGEGVSANAMGEIWYFFEQELKYPVSIVNSAEFRQINLREFDVLILPDGNYGFLNDKNTVEELRSWIQQGGRLIALENAVAQLSAQEWAIRKIKADEPKKDDNRAGENALPLYENRERDFLKNAIPGAIYKVTLDHTHPLAFGYPAWFYTLKQDDNLYEFFKDNGWNVGVIRNDAYVAGFAGMNTRQKLKNGVLFGVQDIGRGNIIYLADDPIFRGFWENGKLMLANAVFLVGQ